MKTIHWTTLAAVAATLTLSAAIATAQPGGPRGDRGERQGPPRMEQLDANRDGLVSQDEFLAAWLEHFDAGFTLRDLNGDGVLSEDELRPRGPRPGAGEPGAQEGRRQGPPPGELDRPRGEGRGAGPRGAEGEGPRRFHGEGAPQGPREEGIGRPGGPMGPGPMGRGMGPGGIRPPAPEALDANGDGIVTREEHATAWADAIAAHFNALDADGDGVLTAEELPRGPGGPAGPGGRFQGERPGPPPANR